MSDRLDHMYLFAKKYHDMSGAVRKATGDPYIVHPEGVADIAAFFGANEDELLAALAHDLVEDTVASTDKILAKFGPRVLSLVLELTNDDVAKKSMGKESYMNQKLVRMSADALFIKLCDMLYNMRDNPTEAQAMRMSNNIKYLVQNRKELDNRHWQLISVLLGW